MGLPEAWLRGPLEGVAPLLMPAAHALVGAAEDIERAVEGLDVDQLWGSMAGAATLGFHLKHVAGSLDRLLTYARGEALTGDQRAFLAAETSPGDPAAPAAALVAGVHAAVERALAQLRATRPETLLEPRGVGREQLPSTVLGLLFHAAEHTQRHTGQIVTTARIVRAASAE
ncbi:MAG TPA: DinB family protein [Longimicrobium sp.]|nr:DinB family protein [Longimicrobium sp.]